MTEPLIITTSAREDHQLAMSIQLGPERTEKALRQAAKRVSKQVRIPGFRPGKAPFRAVLTRFGRDALLSEILDDLGQEVFKEALEQEQIEPYAQAELEDVELDPVTFKLVIPLVPEVELGDYRSIRLEAPEVSVTDEDVDDLLEDLRDERAEMQSVDRPAEVGDTVILDISGAVGDESIMDNQDWELVLRSESGWLPGFNDAFVGMSAGEEKTFSLTYPEDSASRYKGQEATFTATLKEVRTQVQPELDDDFARSLGDFEDLADLRAKVRENLLRERTAEAEEQLNQAAIDALLERATLSYPAAAIDDEVHAMLHELENQLSPSGYSLEDYLRLQSKTREQYEEEIRPQAEIRLRRNLVLQELIRAEGIEVTDEESDAKIDELTNAAEDEDRAQVMRDLFDSELGQRALKQSLLNRKALARLRAIVTGQGPDLAPVGDEASAPEIAGEVGAEAAVEEEVAVDHGPQEGDESAASAHQEPVAEVESADDPVAVADDEPTEAATEA